MQLDDTTIADEIKKIETKTGRITEESLIEAARPRNHPLHPEFTWDDKIAGHTCRIQEARRLINRVKYIIVYSETVTLKAPVYGRDTSLPPDEQGYRRIAAITAEKDKSKLMEEAINRAIGHLNTAFAIGITLGHAADCEKIIDAAEALAAKIRGK